MKSCRYVRNVCTPQQELTTSAFRLDGHAAKFNLSFEDMDGTKRLYGINIAFYGTYLTVQLQ